jgi:hypothetical protein
LVEQMIRINEKSKEKEGDFSASYCVVG